MNERLQFTADAALIDRLGRELVGKQETALIELVKNSYDADATEVTVTLDGSELIVADNGTGMSREELVSGFLRLASNMKAELPRSRVYNRQRAGRKGIGRFATQRLGSQLTLRTWQDDSSAGLQLEINWALFEPGRMLQDIPVALSAVPSRMPGTVLTIAALRDRWTDGQVQRCWRGLLNLQQPFPVAPIKARPGADPGFKVGFYRASTRFEDPELIADLQTEVLDYLHAVVEFRVDGTGRAEWRLTQNRFGPDRNWTPIHHSVRDAPDPPAYSALQNVYMKAHYFILAPELIPSSVYARLRDVLRVEGGIRLYRNGFRVVPYGDPGDDWLRLDQIYGQRGSILAPIANRNFFGVIEVFDPEGRDFEEHTSREGLIDTPALSELKGLAGSVIATAVTRIAEDRGRKTSAGSARDRSLNAALKQLRDAEDRARQAAKFPPSSQPDPESSDTRTEAPTAQQTAELIRDATEILEGQQAELADEAALLRLLATLGLTTSEFSHETGMTFEAVRMDFDHVFKVAVDSRSEDNDFCDQADRARSMLERLDALTAYLNELASARSIREKAPVSVSKAIEDFKRGMGRLAEKSEIELEIDTPAFDALFTRPMHRAEIASILLNFYSNSVKAMRRTGVKRRISIDAQRESDSFILVRFADTGDGILPDNREKVFDLFFTTRNAAATEAPASEQMTGTGLGLWIVHQIVSKVGGDVSVVDPPESFTTCLELRLPAEEEKE